MNNVKNKLNIIGRCYIKTNAVGGEILSFIPDLPISAFLDDMLFILSVPSETQKYSSAYMRLANKKPTENKTTEEVKEFSEVRTIGYLKEGKNNRGDIIVVAPRQHIFVNFSEVVVIATLPEQDKFSAPCYIKKKIYNKSKSELDGNIETKVIDDFSDMTKEQVEQIMEEINQ